jgi:hypothetical protein
MIVVLMLEVLLLALLVVLVVVVKMTVVELQRAIAPQTHPQVLCLLLLPSSQHLPLLVTYTAKEEEFTPQKWSPLVA